MPEQPNPTEIDQPTPSEQQPGAAYPDVPAEAWSGVHRGPLREGEWVRLTDSKGRKHNFELQAGKRFFSNKGHLDHDDLIGREEGFTLASSAGGEDLVFRPLLSEFVVSMQGAIDARQRFLAEPGVSDPRSASGAVLGT